MKVVETKEHEVHKKHVKSPHNYLSNVFPPKRKANVMTWGGGQG